VTALRGGTLAADRSTRPSGGPASSAEAAIFMIAKTFASRRTKPFAIMS
jgi:hypothetical protein